MAGTLQVGSGVPLSPDAAARGGLSSSLAAGEVGVAVASVRAHMSPTQSGWEGVGGVPTSQRSSASAGVPGLSASGISFGSAGVAGMSTSGRSFGSAGVVSWQQAATHASSSSSSAAHPSHHGAAYVARPLLHPHAASLPAAPPPARVVDCQDQQCAEEECDPEECGDETRPPREPKDDDFVCGIDRRPLLPVLLVASTMCGALCMLLVQFPLVRDLQNGAYGIRATFLLLYVVTIACMVYCTLSDPGQLKREDHRQALMQELEEGEDPPLPRRAHKTWLYKLPVRRYDHYCRWLTNVIGLLNHREFVAMMVGLVFVGVFGGALDFFLILFVAREGRWAVIFLLIAHMAYSGAVLALVAPILQLHVGFVSRNELANEWKRNDFYVARSPKSGALVPVNELSDDDFNERFDSFQYDASRNSFDRGTYHNCWTFWCVRRWRRAELGEF